jgi:hypothetical protein
MPVSLRVKDYPAAQIKLIGKPLQLNKSDLTRGSFFIVIPKKIWNLLPSNSKSRF